MAPPERDLRDHVSNQPCTKAASFIPSVACMLPAGAVSRGGLLPKLRSVVSPKCGLMGAKAPKPLPCRVHSSIGAWRVALPKPSSVDRIGTGDLPMGLALSSPPSGGLPTTSTHPGQVCPGLGYPAAGQLRHRITTLENKAPSTKGLMLDRHDNLTLPATWDRRIPHYCRLPTMTLSGNSKTPCPQKRPTAETVGGFLRPYLVTWAISRNRSMPRVLEVNTTGVQS